MLGLRFAGLRGALAAFAGLVLMPMVVVLCAMGLYLRFQDVTAVRQMLAGMTAVAAGLVLSTGVKLAQSQPRTVRAIAVGVAAFVAIGLLRWPLLPVMAVLVPVALVLEYRAMRKGRMTSPEILRSLLGHFGMLAAGCRWRRFRDSRHASLPGRSEWLDER
jgi:chromate transporter